MIDWSKGTKAEHELASKIAKRAVDDLPGEWEAKTVAMDIIAAHTHGCKLKLKELLEANWTDFLHDICGINRHINHDTGELMDCFLPRYAA